MNVISPAIASPASAAFIEHGGRISTAQALYPDAPDPWIDLSTGICPWPYPIPPLAVEWWSRLPDTAELEKLAAAARRTYNAPTTANVLALAGSDQTINLLPRLVPGAQDVAIVSPTYMPHESAWAAAGHRVRRISGPSDIRDCDIGVVVNPNNPDGRVWPASAIHEAAVRVGQRNGFLIVDEAFADVLPGSSILQPDCELSNIVVLRSFGKFYGLAGVRLGFAITAHPIGATLAGLASEWPVSGPAIAIGQAALADVDWAQRNIKRLAASVQRLDDLLLAADFAIVGGTSLFRLALNNNATDAFDKLARHGILTRPFNVAGQLRFGIPADNDAFSRLAAALKS